MISIGLIAAQEALRSAAEERFQIFGLKFADPWFLVLIPLVWFLGFRAARARSRAKAIVPGLTSRWAPPGARTKARSVTDWTLVLAKVVAVSMFLVALSRPLEGREVANRESEGIDISLLIDRSSSMDARATPKSKRRFDIVREVVADFALRRMTDEEGARDNISLTGFAAWPEVLVPFTLDAEALIAKLEEVDIETARYLDGTAIGAAMAEAVKILKESEAKSRIIVLLTDGVETEKFIEPLEVAEAAAELGIKIYTVFAGPREIRGRTLLGGVRTQRVDVGDLPQIAEITEGKFFHAESVDELEAAYEEIEALERTQRIESSFSERFDLYPRVLGPAVLLYFMSLLIDAGLSLIARRRLP